MGGGLFGMDGVLDFFFHRPCGYAEKCTTVQNLYVFELFGFFLLSSSDVRLSVKEQRAVYFCSAALSRGNTQLIQ